MFGRSSSSNSWDQYTVSHNIIIGSTSLLVSSVGSPGVWPNLAASLELGLILIL